MLLRFPGIVLLAVHSNCILRRSARKEIVAYTWKAAAIEEKESNTYTSQLLGCRADQLEMDMKFKVKLEYP